MNETSPEHPVPQDEPATNTNTTLLDSAASSDQTNDMECTAASMKRGVHADSSDDDIDANPIKKSASSSPAGKRPGTHVSRERGRELAKISSFPSTPRSGEQRANRGSLSPIRPPSFNSGGSSRRTYNHEKPPPPQTQRRSCENTNS